MGLETSDGELDLLLKPGWRQDGQLVSAGTAKGGAEGRRTTRTAPRRLVRDPSIVQSVPRFCRKVEEYEVSKGGSRS